MIVLNAHNHPDFSTLTWTVYGSGWLQLDYTYPAEGDFAVAGISFDYPETRMLSKTWLGKGPYRVWKNREKGPTTGVWFNTYKNFTPNTAWDYPEFTGYFADINWVVFDTDDGPITLAVDDAKKYLRIYSQPDGEDPRYTKMIWPAGDISILDCIPPIGTKFRKAEEYGPQSQLIRFNEPQKGRLYLYFGEVGR